MEKMIGEATDTLLNDKATTTEEKDMLGAC
jgi:hypothetical protein